MKPKHKRTQYFLGKGLFANLTNFSDLENKISELPQNERGDAFEVFAEAYFRTQASAQANEVWPDKELPQSIRHELGLPPTDMGIDGIFRVRDGAYHAYQAKYRSNRSSLTWDDLSTFMALSDKSDKRVLFTNSNDISSVMNSRIDFYSIKGNDLDRLNRFDFQAIEQWLQTGKVVREKKTPLRHQEAVLHDILTEFEVSDRATAIMACGTGKTLVALWAAERSGAQTILVLLPSLALVRQTLYDWAHQNGWSDFNYLCVCSDATVVAGNDETIFQQHDLDFPVTTKKEDIERYLKNQNITRKIIFSTYQSCQVVAEAMAEGFSFDLAIFDEAHKTASRQGANYAFALQDKNLSIKKRLFLTATPRHYNVAKKDKEGDRQIVFSMDDQATYGRVVHQLSFRAAVQKGLICDYKIIISIVTSDMITRDLMSRGEVLVGGDIIKAQRIANLLAMQSAVDKYGVKRIFSFHNSVNSAKSFTAKTNEGIGAYLSGFATLHVNGEMSTSKREALLKEFEEAKKAVISNARCLTEGVNIPVVDMVAFISPKKSQVDIVQAAGRAMRKAPGKDVGYILIPLFVQVAEDENIEQALQKTKFDIVWDVLQAMQEQDESLVEIIRQMREERGRTLGFNDNRLRERVEILGPAICMDELRGAITTRLVDKLGSSWDERFGELVRYKEENGHCDVLRSYRLSNGERSSLQNWVTLQRAWKKKGLLAAEKIAKLNKLEFDWDPLHTAWEKKYVELCEFRKVYGHCHVPDKWTQNMSLAIWVGGQRSRHKRGCLDQDFFIKLDKLGFDWDPEDTAWRNKFIELEEFKKDNGDCNVPRSYGLSNSEQNPLASWVCTQRVFRKKGLLPEEKITMLNRIEFDWDPVRTVWEKRFLELYEFHKVHGHCNVGRKYLDKKLSTWVNEQRTRYKKKILPQDQIDRLEALKFIWALRKRPNKKPWDEMFMGLVEYKQMYGDCNVPDKWEQDVPLGIWVGTQRSSHKKSKITDVRFKKLSDLGFDWDPLKTREEQMFVDLERFMERHGHSKVTLHHTDNHSLVNWISNQRVKSRKRILSFESQDRFHKLGYQLNPRKIRTDQHEN